MPLHKLLQNPDSATPIEVKVLEDHIIWEVGHCHDNRRSIDVDDQLHVDNRMVLRRVRKARKGTQVTVPKVLRRLKPKNGSSV
jgi:hypothetical protein